MASRQKLNSESQAIAAIDIALEGLPDDDSRGRVLDWAVAKYGRAMRSGGSASFVRSGGSPGNVSQQLTSEESDSWGPRTRAWMKRHDIRSQALDAAFHIEGDNSTLILKSINGDSKSERLRNVAALLGAMALIRNDQPKFTSGELREALKQYNAYDMTNNPSYVKRHKDVIQGNGSSGYTITSIGLDLAANLLKSLSFE